MIHISPSMVNRYKMLPTFKMALTTHFELLFLPEFSVFAIFYTFSNYADIFVSGAPRDMQEEGHCLPNRSGSAVILHKILCVYEGR